VLGLSRVSLTLSPGILGIVGPNGSGKSTLVRVLTGLVAPSEGTLSVLGGDPFRNASIRRRIAVVPATECFFDGISARRNLEIVFRFRGYSRREASARAAHALHLVQLEADGNRVYRTWSRGMRQRLKLAVALEDPAELVLLDEPFLGVDPPSRIHLRTLIEKLSAEGRTVLVSSHVLHEIESLTSRVAVLAFGRVLGLGHVSEILSELRDAHPHRLRLEVDEPRRLASELVRLTHVREVRVVDHGVELVTEHPEVAYREIAATALGAGLVLRRLEPLDQGLEAVFHTVTRERR
jgi:ABC-2 type transport system ATP-binding protein